MLNESSSPAASPVSGAAFELGNNSWFDFPIPAIHQSLQLVGSGQPMQAGQ